MGLAPGVRLGPYEIAAPLGAGGMGEVYRARDTRLDRTVAIKILNSGLTSNEEMKARFEREARAISQLQHPHICTLFDIGAENGTEFLVMEYLEGETLAQRLIKGALPLEQALKVGTEVADALWRAHRAGIVHRDLKPGNIMLTKSGAKLLDFGLAKSAGMAAAIGGAPLLSAALTMTTPSPQLSPVTTQGTLLGTIQYMSPEQLEGKEADARSDIFALGAVLYEITTGRRAFEGKSQLSVATAILEKDPEPLNASIASAPAALNHVIRTCLAKDPEERWQDAGDVSRQLQWVASSPETPSRPAGTSPKPKLAWAAAGVVIAALAGWAGFNFNSGRQPPVIAAEISAPAGLAFASIGDLAGVPVLSPQGDRIAFAAQGPNSIQSLWVRPLNSLNARRLDGTENAAHPFWSPDGRNLGFYNDRGLNRISANGGPVTLLVAGAVNARGATWGGHDVIIYTPDFRSGLMQISANGGKATPATVLDTQKHTTHRWPWFLPDGKHFLYTAMSHGLGQPDANGIYFASLDGKENRLVVSTDSDGIWASGYLLYHLQNSLVAQAFDPSSGKLTGDAMVVAGNVRYDAGVWRTVFTASQNGMLAYQPAMGDASGEQLVWLDRNGKVLREVGQRTDILQLRLSPDGKKLAVIEGNPNWDLWVLDLERGTKTRITFNEGTVMDPSWSPDGKSLFYAVIRPEGNMHADIRTRAANAAGAEQTIGGVPQSVAMPSVSPGGEYLVYLAAGGTIWAKPLRGSDAPFEVAGVHSAQGGQAGETEGSDAYRQRGATGGIAEYRLSPDGRWLAYMSEESGRPEVYVVPFPRGEGKWQVSTDGAGYPVWQADGKQLFIKDLTDQVYAVAIAARGNDLEIGSPRLLFRESMPGWGASPYDVSMDGQQFIVNKAEQQGAAPLYLVANWPAALKK
ncbi:MAG: serine/threonine-protein kinase [Acidobacteria bacterium]|nr:serine/threonine-protein kinase [Acidobacteriota bacterium]